MKSLRSRNPDDDHSPNFIEGFYSTYILSINLHNLSKVPYDAKREIKNISLYFVIISCFRNRLNCTSL